MLNMGWPPDLTLYKFLTDWGSFIGGGIALIAGVLAYIGARQAAAKQIAALSRKDRLQARSLAVAILPELLQLKVRHERATKIIGEEFPKAKASRGILTAQVVSLILSAQIGLPPLLSRTVDQLYILEDAGPALLQLISVILQYDGLIRTLAEQINANVDSFNPAAHQQNFAGQLHVIAQDIAEAERLIGPIHDEATRSGT
jgi:hypothetical protein